MIGLVLSRRDFTTLQKDGFDGGFSYFASDGFTGASTSSSWGELTRIAQEHGLVFLPSVGPGYDDRRYAVGQKSID